MMHDSTITEKLFRTIIPMDCGVNLRSLNGLPVAQGRVIADDLFYRGPAPCAFLKSEHDREIVESFALQLILDLRSAAESEAAPDPSVFSKRIVRRSAICYPGTEEEVEFSPESREKIAQILQTYNVQHHNASKGKEAGIGLFYQSAMFGNGAWEQLMQALKNEEVPLMFHCVAGKDRTGLASALILLLLGADRETVMADFLFSNVCRYALIEKQQKALLKRGYSDRQKAWEDAISQIGVKGMWLEGALDAVESRYGSWEEYFAKEFSISAECRERMIQRYTVPLK